MRAGYHAIIDHYEQCLAEHGDTHRGVDWPNAADAETRYRVMLDLLPPPNGKHITLLDFGCGAAHLFEYLARNGRSDVRYIGVDASPQFIELARRKFPHNSFECIDVLASSTPLPEADFIVMNGVLTEKRGLSFDEMFEYMTRLVERVYHFARCGLAFNVMSQHVDWQREDLFHVPYDALAAFLKANVSRHFAFRADYGLYEYTAYVFREPR